MIVTARAAVDPGKSGGIAVRNDDGTIILTGMPDTAQEIVDLLTHIRLAGVKKLDLENIVLFNGTRRPGASMAVYASNFGVVKGAALALGFTMTLVSPQQWQSALGIKSAPGPKWKALLADHARTRFPGTTITLKTADAALLAAAIKQGIPNTIRCGTCFRLRPPAAFYKNAGGGSACKDCAKLKPTRPYWLKYNYGITETEYQTLLTAQENVCAICLLTPNHPLNVDHNHTTKEVRGLLCRNCNWGLGNFADSPDRLSRAIAYLK